MEPIVQRCVGIDIGKITLKATLRVQGGPGRKTRREVRSFETTTVELLRLRDWVIDEQVTLVGMKSTGVYWKPIFYLLEEVVECWLLNAQHLKKVPGRKTDLLTELLVSRFGWCVPGGSVLARFAAREQRRRASESARAGGAPGWVA
jgi:transposase